MDNFQNDDIKNEKIEEKLDSENEVKRENHSRRKQIKKEKSFKKYYILLAVLAVILLVRIVSGMKSKAVTEGEKYLLSLEAVSVEDVEKQMANSKKAKLAKEKDKIIKELESGQRDIWKFFSDAMVMGDSRIIPFSHYELIPKNRVIADYGLTIRDVEKHIDEIKTINPQYLFLSFGINDVGIGYWKNGEEYAKEYSQLLGKLKKILPNTKFMINSILPALEETFEDNPAWKEIPNYSKATKAMCEKEGYGWVDCDQLAMDHKDYYYDGVHFEYDIYPLWGKKMQIDALDYLVKSSQAEPNQDKDTQDVKTDGEKKDGNQ